MSSHTTEKFDADCWRVFAPTGELVGFALALANGRWSANDAEDRNLTVWTFEIRKQVCEWFDRQSEAQTND